jgi:hypothetical protein
MFAGLCGSTQGGGTGPTSVGVGASHTFLISLATSCKHLSNTCVTINDAGLRHQQYPSASDGSELPPALYRGVASRADGARMLRLREVMEIVGLKRTYIYQLQKVGGSSRAQ